MRLHLVLPGEYLVTVKALRPQGLPVNILDVLRIAAEFHRPPLTLATFTTWTDKASHGKAGCSSHIVFLAAKMLFDAAA